MAKAKTRATQALESKPEPEEKDERWRASVDLVEGNDFILRFKTHTAAKAEIYKSLERGYFIRDRTDDQSNVVLTIHPITAVRVISLYQAT